MSNSPIAGFGDITVTQGLTTQNFYEVDLTDNPGLVTTTGITLTNRLGGTYTVSLAATITKLGLPIAQGGAGLIFASGTPESAIVSINAENEISFSDAQGRSIMERQNRANTVRPPNLPPFSRPVLAVLGMAFVLSGCSKTSAVHPLDTGSPSDVESCHDIVLCIT